MAKPRVLHVITVYNGKAFVPAAIASAMRFDDSEVMIDVLVLDDASPAPGWSADLAALCKKSGALYYCTPRNLGIPRNVNLGLLTAVKRGYDYVTINNSDVIFPRNLISVMVQACRQPKVGSVTAWSNNVSIYSLPNTDPDRFLADQAVVDFVSAQLAIKYGAHVLDIPAGISFCIMMPIQAVKDVGLMDPIFGRGYCEETDWSLRSLQAGYRLCLAPGAFVYHQGRGSNLAAGLVSAHHTTVPENEVIIDMRYPGFRRQVADFEAQPDMAQLKARAVTALIDAAAQTFGYCIDLGWAKTRIDTGQPMAHVELLPDGIAPSLRYSFCGFEEFASLPERDIMAVIEKRFGIKAAHNALNRAAELAGLHSLKPDLAKTRTNNYPAAAWVE